jgi:hypothetical protein
MIPDGAVRWAAPSFKPAFCVGPFAWVFSGGKRQERE